MNVVTTATPTWCLRALDPPSLDDARRISEFLQSQIASQRHASKDHFTQWKLRDNETHPGFASVMQTETDGRIVSVCTVTPKRLWHRGRTQYWGEIGDTFTDAAFLRKGMFKDLVNASRSRAQAAGFEIIYGLPNDQSLPGYIQKLEFRVKDDLRLDKYSLLLTPRPIAARLSGRMGSVAGILASGSLAHVCRRMATLAVAAKARGNRALTVKRELEFGPEFDELWTRARGHLSIAQVRDAAYLTWRYHRNPFPFVVLAARDSRGRLAGYIAALTIPRSGPTSFVHTMISDWLLDPAVNGVRAALVGAAVRYAIDEGADVVSAMTSRSTPLMLPLQSWGFMRRQLSQPVIVHANPAGAELLADPADWHFTFSDTDGF